MYNSFSAGDVRKTINLGDQFGEKIVVDNCAAAIAYLKKAKNPVVTALPFESMAKQNDGSKNACAIPKKSRSQNSCRS